MRNRRKMNRRALQLLPDWIRLDILRRHVPICGELPSQVEIKIASTADELAAAYRLLHDSYVSEGFMKPHSSGMRVLIQHMLPQNTTIVATYCGKVVGTLSLIRDNPFGLPLEKLFDISPRRAGGKRLTEVSSLAIDPSFRGKVDQVLFPLFRYVYHYGLNYFGTHEFVIAVNPSMVDLYRAFMGFEKLDSPVKPYDFVNGAPAVGLYIVLDGMEERWTQAFKHCPQHVKWFFAVPSKPGYCLPSRDYYVSSDFVLTPEMIEELFLKRAGFARTLTAEQTEILASHWNDPRYRAVFDRIPEICKFNKQREIRIDVQMPARSRTKEIEGEALNVSLQGLQLRTSGLLDRDQILDLEVSVNSSKTVALQTRVAWGRDGVFGLEILSNSIEWVRMVRSLKKKIEELGDGAEASKVISHAVGER